MTLLHRLFAVVLALLYPVSLPAHPMAPEYDLVIRGGRVLDGAGNPWVRADVAIRGGRFVRIGRVPGKGRREIDATGRYVSPGWIDANGPVGRDLARQRHGRQQDTRRRHHADRGRERHAGGIGGTSRLFRPARAPGARGQFRHALRCRPGAHARDGRRGRASHGRAARGDGGRYRSRDARRRARHRYRAGLSARKLPEHRRPGRARPRRRALRRHLRNPYARRGRGPAQGGGRGDRDRRAQRRGLCRSSTSRPHGSPAGAR